MIPIFEALQSWLQVDAAWVWVLLAVASLIPCLIAFLAVQVIAGASTYVERKVAADIQRRVGPNQCNPNLFLGVFAREAAERGKSPKADFGGKVMGALLGAALPLIDILDKIGGRWAPGLLIFLADGIKLIMKESIVPASADKPLFKIAPVIVLASAFGALAALPYSSWFYIADFNIGIFFVVAITSLETIGILMAGWASNNKWALLGGMRSAAQIVSYEIPTSLAVLTAIILAGTMSLQGMIFVQIGINNLHQGWFWQWNLFSSPFALILAPAYFLAALAECNRTPFDIPEAESELVAGYHTEYTGMRFAIFFMAEYAMMCVLSGLAVAIFLGGWSTGIGPIETGFFMKANIGEVIPGTNQIATQPIYHWWAGFFHFGVFALKTYALVFIMMWIRWTLPRFRVDQMMSLCWTKLIPIGLFCLNGVAIWSLLRPYAAKSLGGWENYHNLVGWMSLLVAIALIGWVVKFFLTPLTTEEQERRKLIAVANLNKPVSSF